MTENQKNYVDGFITGLVNNYDGDFCSIDGFKKRGAEYVFPIEAMDDTNTCTQINNIVRRINAMLEDTRLPYVANINLEIVLTPKEGGEE